MAEQVQYYGTGRRKTSTARVFLRPGEGKFTINDRPFEEYFVTEAQRVDCRRWMGYPTLNPGQFDYVRSLTSWLDGVSLTVKLEALTAPQDGTRQPCDHAQPGAGAWRAQRRLAPERGTAIPQGAG